MTPRPSRILAIAHRDLRIELGGRRGLVLPFVTTLLLAPLAAAPRPAEPDDRVRVRGDVPAVVAMDPGVVVDPEDRRAWRLDRDEDGTVRVHAPIVPHGLRRSLDTLEDRLQVTNVPPPSWSLPKRSLLLALISASMITGALAQSIPGERSSRTLETLMTASVSRAEIVLGKWLAWGGFGALSGTIACVTAVLLGRQEAGWWLLTVPWVPLATVAVGLALVRRAPDVVGGATVAIRSLPAVLATAGGIAWWLGDVHPLLGAAVPIGGALVAAGDLWAGPAPAALAIGSAATACGAALALTARDLDASEARTADEGLGRGLAVAALAAAVTWTPVLGPLLWTAGGTRDRTDAIPLASGQVAAVLGLVLLATVLVARDRDAPALGFAAPPRSVAWGLGGGALLAAASAVAARVPPVVTAPGLRGEALARLDLVAVPVLPGVVLAAAGAAAAEVVFRGWMAHRVGRASAVVAWVAVIRPASPGLGLVEALLLDQLAARTGSLVPGVVARVVLVGAVAAGLV